MPRAVRHPLTALYGLLGPRYPRVVLALQFQVAHLVVLGGCGLLAMYLPMSAGEFWLIVAVAEGVVLVENLMALAIVFRLVSPAVAWRRGDRSAATTVAAWRALTGLPRDYLRAQPWWRAIVALVPVSVGVVLLLELPWYSVAVLVPASAVVLLYGVVLRFFLIEQTMRPMLQDVARALPDGVDLGRGMTTLRTKLLATLPAVNIVTGVAVAGLSSTGDTSLGDLGLDVLVAVGVAFTISLELTLLLARSVVGPVRDLHRATDRVAAGDLGVRVPVTSTDETGALTTSFNQMVAGLEERERLREALGTYVDPGVADRILREGTTLEGEEVDVSVLFVDIVGFTAFAERASAPEVVRTLNGFYERVVPVLTRHGGHANAFVGDGLLGVFGAPERRDDHADRAVAAALEIAAVVRLAYGDDLRVGVGVNSGRVVAGTVGGGGHLEFTVIGDVVNTAARVEAATRTTGDDVLVTGATRARLHSVPCTLEPRAPVTLRGKREPVVVWACAPRDDAVTTGVGAATAR